ncbi:MAG: aminotransferase [Rhodothermaceae bacterium]|nr:MAG: aminotransferase [Rhodothermaceae bacterium]
MLPCQKDLFFLPESLHYLNCAYMAPLSKQVEAAGIEGIRRKRVPASITPADFFDESDAIRRRFARLIHLDDPMRVAIIPAVSYGLATVAKNVRLRPGQNIVVLHEQFPSNVYAWRRLQHECGVTLRTVKPPETATGRGRAWNERLLEAIDPDTGLVALPHVHWTDGTVFDLERIGAHARAVGAVFVVDGTQSVGALPFDVRAIRPDALVCAGYKWLLGPYGLGLAYYGPRFDDGVPLEENWITRRGSEDFAGLVRYTDAYQPGAVRYDVGERSNFALVPMLRAALDHLLAWGVENIRDYCRALCRDLIETARTMGFRVEDEAYCAAHLFGFRTPAGLSMDRLRAALDARRVSVSVRGNALRIAPHVYNDAADVDALREALHEAVHQPA